MTSLQKIYNEDNSLLKQKGDLSILLNGEPKKEWVKRHPIAKGVLYLPVERVEYLLNVIFVRWWVEIRDTKVVANSIVVTLRLHVEAPDGNKGTIEMWQDGIGASPIQTAKRAAATDFSKVNTMAVMQAAPAAESYALKDAAEKFGRIFGKDLNRNTHSDYSVLMSKYGPLSQVEDQPEKENPVKGMSLEEISMSCSVNPEWKNDQAVWDFVIEEIKLRQAEIKEAISKMDIKQMKAYWEENKAWHDMKRVKDIFANREIELQDGQ